MGCAIVAGTGVVYFPVLLIALIAIGCFIAAFATWPVQTFLGVGGFLIVQDAAMGFAASTLNVNPLLLKYADETLILVMFVMSVLSPRRIDRLVAALVFILVLVGLLSSFLASVSIVPMAIDGYLMTKGFLLYLVGASLPVGTWSVHLIVRYLLLGGFVILLSLGLDYLAPGLQAVLVGSDEVQYRLGYRAAQGLFAHPGNLQQVLVFAALGCLGFYTVVRQRFYLFASAAFLLGSLMSLRLKPLLLFPATIILGFAFFRRRKSQAGSVRKGVIVFVGALFVAFVFSTSLLPRIFEVKSTEISKSARAALTQTSIRIAVDYFPLGAGLGRYGGSVSRDYYSPIYEEYGLSDIHGVSEQTGEYVADTHWPYVLGELGFLGLAVYLGIVLVIVHRTLSVFRDSSNKIIYGMAFGVLLILTDAMMEGVASPIFQGSLNGYLTFGAAGFVVSRFASEHAKDPSPTSVSVT